MRVLLVSHRFPPDDVGGVERYTQDLADELARCGDTVSIVTRRSERERKGFNLLRERLPKGPSLYRFVTGSFKFEHFLENHAPLEQFFIVAMIESRPEIVHINHLLGLSPRFIHIARRLGAAVVVSLHDFYFVCPRVHLQKPSGELCTGPDDGRECVKACFPEGTEQGQERWALRSEYFRRALTMADRIICYSNYVASYFRNIAGDQTPIQVIPNGVLPGMVEVGRSRSNGNSHATLTLAYCGTVAPHKGPHVILEALEIAGLRSVKLVVVGHFPVADYARQLRQRAAAMPGLTLKMYGTYERKELQFLLQDIDCVVVPSLVPEAGPIVPREALAQGVPVLAARLGALTEIIREGENGFTFNPDRPGELAQILQRLAADRQLRMRLRTGARMSSVTTVAQHAELVRSVYQSALERSANDFGKKARAAEFNFLHNALLDRQCDPCQTHVQNKTP